MPALDANLSMILNTKLNSTFSYTIISPLPMQLQPKHWRVQLGLLTSTHSTALSLCSSNGGH